MCLPAGGGRAVEVVLQRGPVVRVRALVDDLLGATSRRQAAQVRHALLGDDDVHVVLGVVDVAHHRHDARDRPVLGRRRGEEHRDVGIAGEVAGPADAVLHARPHDVGGVDVAVDVGLDHSVHGQTAEPADDLGVVADLLRPQHDPVVVRRRGWREFSDAVRAERERAVADANDIVPERSRASMPSWMTSVYDVNGGSCPRPARRARHWRRCRRRTAAAAGRRQAVALHLVGEELEHVPGDQLRRAVHRPATAWRNPGRSVGTTATTFSGGQCRSARRSGRTGGGSGSGAVRRQRRGRPRCRACPPVRRAARNSPPG